MALRSIPLASAAVAGATILSPGIWANTASKPSECSSGRARCRRTAQRIVTWAW